MCSLPLCLGAFPPYYLLHMLPPTLTLAAVLRLIAVLLATGLVTFAVTVLAMAMALLRPPRMGDGKALFFLKRLTPRDLDLPYENVHFDHPDPRTGRPLRFAGWWIPHDSPSEQTAVILHGYSDAKIGGIAWAPLLRSLGYNVLAIDLRAHGHSHGRYSTAGYFERHDVSGIIDQLKSQRPEQTRKLLLMGVSLGSAVAAATAVLRTDLSAVVLECPFLDFPHAVLSHADKLGVPGHFFQRCALQVAQWIAGADYGQVRPVNLIGKIPCPLWVVQAEDDPFVPAAEQAQVAAAVLARPPELGLTRLWQVANCHHVIALAEHPAEYRQRLMEFLAEVNGNGAIKPMARIIHR